MSVLLHGLAFSVLWFLNPYYDSIESAGSGLMPFEVIEVSGPDSSSRASRALVHRQKTLQSQEAQGTSKDHSETPQDQLNTKVPSIQSDSDFLGSESALADKDTGSKSPGSTSATAISALTRMPRLLKEVRANYPKEALEKKISGTVVVDLLLNEKGQVVEVILIEGLGYGLDEAAIQALENFEFAPGYIKNRAVPVKIRYRYRFEINR